MVNFTRKITEQGQAIGNQEKADLLLDFLQTFPPGINRVLIIPPDYTRKHSGAGQLTAIVYHELRKKSRVNIMPALGTHNPMTPGEIEDMFGPDIPPDKFIIHRWRQDTVRIGEIPAAYVEQVSGGVVNEAIEVRINQRLVSGEYDLIISIGQVLPHEVVGMANYNKNIFVGCGGSEMINKSHFVGAAYGMEKIMGRDHSPVRQLYDYAQEHFLKNIPLYYILTVNSTEVIPETGLTRLLGLFIGQDRPVFEQAVRLSQQYNINRVKHPLQKVVVYLDGEEFKSTWLGCKAVYRTRMAIADGGELIIIAPGLQKFGEDGQIDALIRKYGYVGRERVLELVQNHQDLRHNLSAAAHLIHGSADGRFRITYACNQLSREEIEGVNFRYMPLQEAVERYQPGKLNDGFNQQDDGEEIYFIGNPATGLWMA